MAGQPHFMGGRLRPHSLMRDLQNVVHVRRQIVSGAGSNARSSAVNATPRPLVPWASSFHPSRYCPDCFTSDLSALLQARRESSHRSATSRTAHRLPYHGGYVICPTAMPQSVCVWREGSNSNWCVDLAGFSALTFRPATSYLDAAAVWFAPRCHAACMLLGT